MNNLAKDLLKVAGKAHRRTKDKRFRAMQGRSSVVDQEDPRRKERELATLSDCSSSRAHRDCEQWASSEEYTQRKFLPLLLKDCRHVLDLACGDGTNLPFMPAGIEYTGCDCSPNALEHLINRQDHPSLQKRVFVYDTHRLPVGSDSQDAVIAFCALEHLADVPGILWECDRVLRPGGLIVLIGPDFGAANNYAPSQSERLQRSLRRYFGYALGRLARRINCGMGSRNVLFEYVEHIRFADGAHSSPGAIPPASYDGTRISDRPVNYLTDHRTIAKFMAAQHYTYRRLPTRPRLLRDWLRSSLAAFLSWKNNGVAGVVLRKPIRAKRPRFLSINERLIELT